MSFQSSLSGINAASQKLDVIGVNVANAETVGFKESTARFADIYISKAYDGQTGSGSLSLKLSQQFTQGDLKQSDDVLNVAISGKGFFQVMSPDGSLSYTRNGQFHVNKDNYLMTPDGDKVMGADGPIQIDMVKYGGTLRIGENGLIQGSDGVARGPDKVIPDPVNIGKTVTIAGDLIYQDIGTFQLHNFRNINGLVPVGDNKWAESNATGARVSGDPGAGILGLVQGGAMEGSNADLNDNLVNMIIAQREFQGNSQILKVQIDMDLSLAKL